MRKVRIGMFLHTLDSRAVAHVVTTVSGALKEIGADVTIVCATRRENPKVPEGIEVVDLGAGDRPTSFVIPALARLLRQFEFDGLFAHSDGPARVAVLARTLARSKTKLVIVVHRHYSTAGLSHRWLRDRLVALLYPRADLVAGPSPGVVEDLEQQFPRLAGKTGVLPNPAPTHASPDRILQANHKWFDEADTKVLVSVGNVIRKKGYDILLRALRVVSENDPTVRLLIIGRFDDPSYLDELRRYITEADLDGTVDMLGYVPDPLPYIARSNALVHAARSEAFGLVITEALAVGVPVISTDCPGGPSWILGDGEYGLIVPVDDVEAMSEAIIQLLESPELSSNLSTSGLQRARFFDQRHIAESYLRVIERT